MDPVKQLLTRLCARDAAALGELYDQYGATVYSTLWRISRNQATAEELTQEVFLRIWHSVCSFDLERGKLSTWVKRIARNAGIDYLRSRAGQVALRNISLEEVAPPRAVSNPEAEYQAAAEAHQVWEAVGRLPPRHRTLLDWAYREGLSQAEMAERMGVPLGTVKTLVGVALRQLRADLRRSKFQFFRENGSEAVAHQGVKGHHRRVMASQ